MNKENSLAAELLRGIAEANARIEALRSVVILLATKHGISADEMICFKRAHASKLKRFLITRQNLPIWKILMPNLRSKAA